MPVILTVLVFQSTDGQLIPPHGQAIARVRQRSTNLQIAKSGVVDSHDSPRPLSHLKSINGGRFGDDLFF